MKRPRTPRAIRQARLFPSPKGGGPIEAGNNGVCTCAPHTFHRRKAVAPLKLLDDRGRRAAGKAFPSPKGGGPIEARSSAGQLLRTPSSFHRRKAVAPLKRQRRHPADRGDDPFPSPKGGGPIEAILCHVSPSTAGYFPSPKGGGPIEALTPTGTSTSKRSFPSPKGGGPIEARRRNLDSQGPHPHFPSPKGGGPIEARRVPRCCPDGDTHFHLSCIGCGLL